MNWWEAIILGALQGVTEFLPISSSGHLILGEHFLGLNVESLKNFDVAVHVATLLAVLIYFWRDIWGMIKAFGGFFVGKFDNAYANLIFYILIGTVPAVLVGLFLSDAIDEQFRNVKWVGIWMIVVGVVFLIAEWVHKKVTNRGLKWWKAIVIGCAQAAALVPGVSRSGATIVAGLLQGVERSAAARFSFLLGIPAITGAGLIIALGDGAGSSNVETLPMIVGFVTAFVFGFASIWFLMMFLKKHTLRIFAFYRILFGIIILSYFL